MAFTKQQKGALLNQYEKWLKGSQAVFVLEYTKMGMKEVDTLRAKVREAGGELHVVKNTLMGIALKNAGIESKNLVGTSLFGFAVHDVPVMAKIMGDATKNSEIFKLRGGYLSGQLITPENVKALADMPPLPVLRAKVLGMLNAPASKIARTLAEPARQMAYVMKAYAEKAPAAENVPA